MHVTSTIIPSIEVPPVPKEEMLTAEDKHALMDSDWLTYRAHQYIAVLRRGLADRILAIHTLPFQQKVVIGIILNPETAGRLVDLGPPADDATKVLVVY